MITMMVATHRLKVWRLSSYPLVNVYITMERSTIFFMGKSTISMAMASIANCWHNQRLYPINIPLNHYKIPLNIAMLVISSSFWRHPPIDQKSPRGAAPSTRACWPWAASSLRCGRRDFAHGRPGKFIGNWLNKKRWCELTIPCYSMNWLTVIPRTRW